MYFQNFRAHCDLVRTCLLLVSLTQLGQSQVETLEIASAENITVEAFQNGTHCVIFGEYHGILGDRTPIFLFQNLTCYLGMLHNYIATG